MWEMVDFEAVGEVSNAISAGVAVMLRGAIRVSDYYHSVASVNKFLGARQQPSLTADRGDAKKATVDWDIRNKCTLIFPAQAIGKLLKVLF